MILRIMDKSENCKVLHWKSTIAEEKWDRESVNVKRFLQASFFKHVICSNNMIFRNFLLCFCWWLISFMAICPEGLVNDLYQLTFSILKYFLMITMLSNKDKTLKYHWSCFHFKGTLLQIWKSANMFVFIWK